MGNSGGYRTMPMPTDSENANVLANIVKRPIAFVHDTLIREVRPYRGNLNDLSVTVPVTEAMRSELEALLTRLVDIMIRERTDRGTRAYAVLRPLQVRMRKADDMIEITPVGPIGTIPVITAAMTYLGAVAVVAEIEDYASHTEARELTRFREDIIVAIRERDERLKSGEPVRRDTPTVRQRRQLR